MNSHLNGTKGLAWTLRWLCIVLLTSNGLVFGGVSSSPRQSEIEGTVEFIQPVSSQQLQLQLQLRSGTNRAILEVEHSDSHCPARFSRIRATSFRNSKVPAEGQAPTVSRFLVSDPGKVQLLAGSLVPLTTNVAQLKLLGADGKLTFCVAHLDGLVLAASPDNRWIAFQDDSGVAMLEMELPHKFVHAGQQIVLEGNAMVQGTRIQICNPPLVANDGLHRMAERSGSMFLTAGRHAIHLSWFNLAEPHGLEVFYQGSDLPRQRIPDAVLYCRNGNSTNGVKWIHGLDYKCYEGNWYNVPDFTSLIPIKRGVTANFDTRVISRNSDVGLAFSGYLDVPRDGIYTFSTVSDDGSLLFIDGRPPWIEVKGSQPLPEPRIVAAGQVLRAEQPDQWAEVEGTVTFASRRGKTLELVLNSDTGKIDVEILAGVGCPPQLFLHSQIRVVGICRGTYTTDGQIVAGMLLAPGPKQIELLNVAPDQWNNHPVVPIRELADRKQPQSTEPIIHFRGKVSSIRPDGTFLVGDATGKIRVQTLQQTPPAKGSQVEVLGCWNRAETNVIVQDGCCREISGESSERKENLPVLTTVEQIKRLSRAEWQKGYPVRIRGVITMVLDSGFFIQDSTEAIYARWNPPTGGDMPRIGDYREVEGVTFAEFAPNIRVKQAKRLGAGTLPEPIHPTWDQLINGSLDTEYVEVEGIVTAVDSDGVALLTRSGKLNLQLPDVEPQRLPHYLNALVRIRGCVMPVRNIRTQQVELGRTALVNASIDVDEPAPADPFSAPLEHPSDLLLFDPRAGAFQRVKIAGQIVQKRDGEYFLMDGREGLRFIPANTVKLKVGDLVEVVGFPELGGPSPVLREAVVRRNGKAPLPVPEILPQDALFGRRYDSTLVRVRAHLTGFTHDQSGQVLELEAGTRGFSARLNAANGRLLGVAPGSLVELTGVYDGHGGSLASGRDIDSFDLLLNSPADVTVLARPSWWTLRHTLTVVGLMALAILTAVVWITLLHRQVEERSAQLAAEVRRREHTERQRELENERTRIAHDLHDDLGATLTQIRFLSAVESRDAQVPEGARGRMGQISEKSREMVASLDEIVWAVNPTNDSLPNLANYLCHFAEEFFQPTPIRCRLDMDDSLPAASLTSEVRHNLYLAIREAMNNISKHSQATEVWLRIHFQQSELRITIEDNGRGFPSAAIASSGDGLSNMRQRLEKIGGRFELNSQPGVGTVCRIWLPLDSTVGIEQK